MEDLDQEDGTMDKVVDKAADKVVDKEVVKEVVKEVDTSLVQQQHLIHRNLTEKLKSFPLLRWGWLDKFEKKTSGQQLFFKENIFRL